jgi:uncharacterized protein (TIGR02246 family)
MQKRFVLTCVALVWPCLCAAQQTSQQTPQAGKAPPTVTAPQAPAKSPLAALLEAKDRAAWAAFKKKDPEAYAKFLTDDFQAVESDGDGERAKRKVLDEVTHCLYTDYFLQFFVVQPLGTDHAFVTYESTMMFPKTATLRTRRVFIGELWVKQDADWKMMRYQETLVR